MLTIPKSQISDLFFENFLTTEESKCFEYMVRIRYNANAELFRTRDPVMICQRDEYQEFLFVKPYL